VFEVYMDYNATTPVRTEAAEVLQRVAREGFGNPSSTHFAGRRAKTALDDSRERVAATIGARPGEVYFTSGGTESDNLAVKGVAALRGRGHIVTSTIEHPAVIRACRSLNPCDFDVTYLPVDVTGRIDPDAVDKAIRDDTILITIMWANNETGVVQPVEAIGDIAREKDVTFHTDAVQVYGKIPVDVRRIPVDLLTISGHKFCAPMGVGALYVRRGVKLEPIVHGGGQERRLRSGTENLPAIAAMAEAGDLACGERTVEWKRLAELRDRLESGILEVVPDAWVNGADAPRICNTSNICFARANGEAVLIGLDEERIAVSSASACAAGDDEPSHVLMAMGLSRREAEDSMRFSLGRFSSDADVDRCLEVLPGVVGRIRAIRDV
jgi:cysteine desulfurase